MPFKKLDPLLQTPLRLAIISILASTENAEFTYLKAQTGATSGNLSVQISKLEEAQYIKVNKSFRNRKPVTTCRLLMKGKKALATHFDALASYIPKSDRSIAEQASTRFIEDLNLGLE